jgi:hypothetical protein
VLDFSSTKKYLFTMKACQKSIFQNPKRYNISISLKNVLNVLAESWALLAERS